jgi:hypothetical protein
MIQITHLQLKRQWSSWNCHLFVYLPRNECTGRSHFIWFLFAQFCSNATWKFTTLFEVTWQFCFNAIWHRWCVAALIVCRTLPKSDITVMPSVTCMDWLRLWYNHAAHVISSETAQAFLTNVREKCRPDSPSAIQVKSRWKTSSTEEKLNIISWLEKGNELLTYAVMLDLLIVAYIQFMMMLTDLKNVLVRN